MKLRPRPPRIFGSFFGFGVPTEPAARCSSSRRARKGTHGFRRPNRKGIFDLVRDDLALVEQEIAAQNSAAIEPVAEISSYLREGGGKRLRPALLLLAAGAAGYRGEERHPAGRGGGDDPQRHAGPRRCD